MIPQDTKQTKSDWHHSNTNQDFWSTTRRRYYLQSHLSTWDIGSCHEDQLGLESRVPKNDAICQPDLLGQPEHSDVPTGLSACVLPPQLTSLVLQAGRNALYPLTTLYSRVYPAPIEESQVPLCGNFRWTEFEFPPTVTQAPNRPGTSSTAVSKTEPHAPLVL